MSHAIKVLIILVSIGVLILGAFWRLIVYPNSKNLTIDQNVLQNVSVFEKSCEEILSNYNVIKSNYRNDKPDYPGHLVNLGKNTFKNWNLTQFQNSDSLGKLNLIVFVGLNTDCSLYYLTGFKGSYMHLLCYDPNNKAPSLLFAKRENIKSIDTIKPNWTYAIIQSDFD